jgi:hypothetical protein
MMIVDCRDLFLFISGPDKIIAVQFKSRAIVPAIPGKATYLSEYNSVTYELDMSLIFLPQVENWF